MMGMLMILCLEVFNEEYKNKTYLYASLVGTLSNGSSKININSFEKFFANTFLEVSLREIFDIFQ